ncbi:hypothetical protein FMEAI12_5420004 [Parafrankia sp. Ea1.12]|nr:hypothetical protein FMEAI12_5420004 [Parafrankia sp. Ea1.12]
MTRDQAVALFRPDVAMVIRML